MFEFACATASVSVSVFGNSSRVIASSICSPIRSCIARQIRKAIIRKRINFHIRRPIRAHIRVVIGLACRHSLSYEDPHT